ncbi:MAG TPA: serine hydrolase [Pyrinomonadaceae bacterium]|jgi:hypothetical protein
MNPIEKRAEDLRSLLHYDLTVYAKVFSTDFLGQISSEQLASIFASYSGLGACTGIESVGLKSPSAGQFNLIFEGNLSVPVDMAVDESPPHRITHLRMGAPISLAVSFEEILHEFNSLPGQSALCIAGILADKLDVLVAHNHNLQLAIGSTFKLYILSELLRSIDNGEHRWEEITTLDPRLRSLPTGILQQWPAGAPLTLHTLAALMISQSDNTAADHLLFLLGRKRIERMLHITGHSTPDLNVPFLSTIEKFRQDKAVEGRDIDQRASSHGEEPGAASGESDVEVDRDMISVPERIQGNGQAEWFASVIDLCHLVKWIRDNSALEPDQKVLKLLAINPGLANPSGKWQYIGFKGGADTGVMNMTYLLQSTNGSWYSLSGGWNCPNNMLDKNKFVGLINRAAQLIY